MMVNDVRMKGFKSRMSFSKVFDIIREQVKCAGSESVSVEDCVLRVTAEDVLAQIDAPPFNKSAVDGYAVLARDTYGASQYNPAKFKIAGECVAGESCGVVRKGDALRIMTGSMVPRGASACAMAEYCEEKDGYVLVYKPVAGGGNVCIRGEDIKKGTIAVHKGVRITPYCAGVLASVGYSEVKVYRKPKVAIIVTGSELVESKPKSGQIIDSNSHILCGLVCDSGGEVVSKKMVGDDYDDIKDEIVSSDADVIIVTGATSCGKKDYVPLVVDECGELLVHGVAMKPASPFGIGIVNGKSVFLLPGNPVAACVAFDFFVRFALEVMVGIDNGEKVEVRGVLARKAASAVGRTDIFRVKYCNGVVEPVRVGGSGVLSSMIRANAYLVVPENIDGYTKGTEVSVRLF